MWRRGYIGFQEEMTGIWPRRVKKETKRTVDISALAMNFWTALCLSSLSIESIKADAGDWTCADGRGMKATGGDGDVAEDDGVAIHACC